MEDTRRSASWLVAVEAEGMTDWLTWPALAGALSALILFFAVLIVMRRVRIRRRRRDLRSRLFK